MINIPEEMKSYRQWMVGTKNDKGEFKRPSYWNGMRVILGDPTDPQTYMTFEDANNCAQAYGLSVGFVLTENDPFAVIDLDVKNQHNEPARPNKWTTQEELRRYEAIMAAFDSYTEISTSGFGVHIIIKGQTDAGHRRDGVEIYTSGRFMVCTGRSTTNPPKQIEERQQLLDMLVDDIVRARRDSKIDLVELPETETDEVIWNRAINADNSDKFNKLFQGDWQGDYESQSEADLSLMSMFTFYSQSNAQCRRLFRYSGLGKREKAVKDDRYINLTISICRSRQERERLQYEAVEAQARQYVEQLNRAHITTEQLQRTAQTDVPVETTGNNVVIPKGTKEVEGIEWPPGLAGDLARFVYRSSMRPIKEISIITAIGFLSGLLGKAWHIPQSGLNNYLILVAPSGVGKETMNTGVSMITTQVRAQFAGIDRFVSLDKFASGPALRKAFATSTSFINIHGEIGKLIKRMATDQPGGPMSSFRADLTDVYQKSGPQSIASGIAYSDKDKDTKVSGSVAFSLMGETTPGQFFESLTRDMMEDGFLSRFDIVYYDGERPPLNKNPQMTLSQDIIEILGQMLAAASAGEMSDSTLVTFDDDANALCDEYNDKCDNIINQHKDEAIRQAWNRAHLKVLRKAALLAVCDNHKMPVVRLHHVEWAIKFVEHGLHIMLNQWKSGGIGANDETRTLAMMNILNNYRSDLTRACKRYDLRSGGIITKSDLSIATRAMQCFSSHRLGSTVALDQVIKDFVSQGILVPVHDAKKAELKFTGQAWFIAGDLDLKSAGQPGV